MMILTNLWKRLARTWEADDVDGDNWKAMEISKNYRMYGNISVGSFPFFTAMWMFGPRNPHLVWGGLAIYLLAASYNYARCSRIAYLYDIEASKLSFEKECSRFEDRIDSR